MINTGLKTLTDRKTNDKLFLSLQERRRTIDESHHIRPIESFERASCQAALAYCHIAV